MNFLEQLLMMNMQQQSTNRPDPSEVSNQEAAPGDNLQDAYEKYAGQSDDSLIGELNRRRNAGEISDSELERFVTTVAPFLDNMQQDRLQKLLESLRQSN